MTVGDKLADALALNFHRGTEKMSAQDSQAKRLQICGEIVATERSYLEQLSTISGPTSGVLEAGGRKGGRPAHAVPRRWDMLHGSSIC